MKTLKSNLKQPIIFAKIIAVSIAIFLCASCDNGNGKRLAKAKNDPAGTYREYLSDIRRQKKLSIKELAGHLYEGENETYIEASAENSGSTLYDKEIRDKPRTRHTKRNV